jgi:putative ABC transport system permease protein
MIPAFNGAAQINGDSLIVGGQRGGNSPRQTKARSLLVVVEIALALVLVTGAGLLIRNFWALRIVDPCFDEHNVLTMEMSLSGTRSGALRTFRASSRLQPRSRCH